MKGIANAKRGSAVTKEFRDIAKSNLLLGLSETLLGSALGDYYARSIDKETNVFFEKVRAKLSGKKLVVFVDDVDRVAPDAVPRALLTLREALDRPDFFYLMALAPEIVEAGLAQVHPAWGTPKEFLEKIVELPLLLPTPTNQQWKDFVIRQGKKFPPSPLWEADVANYLPRNPRKAKLFFRFASSLQRQLSRFQPEEMDWRSLALSLMLILEFPEKARSLANDSDAISDLEFGWLSDKSDGFGSEKGAKKSKRYEAHAPKVDAERFFELCRALREREMFTRGAYSLKQMLTLHESPPVLTWKELDSLHDAVRAQGIAAVTSWLDGSLPDDRTPRAAAFFSLIREWRNGSLENAAEEALAVDLKARLTDAMEALDILRSYIRARLPFGADEWLQLYSQAAHWAHFNRMGYYTEARAAERDLLTESLDYLDVDAKIEILAKHSLRHDSVSRKRPDEFTAVSDALRLSLQAAVVAAAFEIFEQVDGVEQFWGEKGNSPLKTVVFDAQSPFHSTDAAKDSLRGLARRAVGGDKTLQDNFRTYFRMLTYAAFERGGSFSVQDAQQILKNPEFVRQVWSASVVTPLNPRTMGSLREDRTNVVNSGIPEDLLPLPDWWIETEKEFNASASEPAAEDDEGDE